MILTSSGIHLGGSGIQQVVTARKFIVFFSLIFAAGGWWTARTWKSLWRCGRSAWERAVYDYGVRAFGFSTAVFLTILLCWLGWTADSGVFMGPMMIFGLLAGAFFGVPVGLHLGFFWGNTFASLVAAEHDSTVEIGEPPHLS
jgi:hypothetical protein